MSTLEQMPIGGRERVCCYITRGRELLVFEHDQEYDDGAVGIQVVGGGVDSGETLEQAAIRETFEESGLVFERAVFLGTSHYESKSGALEGQKQVRHYFWLEAPPETPDGWSHTVSSGELDKGMVFHHWFVALEDVDLVFEMGEMLEAVKSFIGLKNDLKALAQRSVAKTELYLYLTLENNTQFISFDTGVYNSIKGNGAGRELVLEMEYKEEGWNFRVQEVFDVFCGVDFTNEYAKVIFLHLGTEGNIIHVWQQINSSGIEPIFQGQESRVIAEEKMDRGWMGYMYLNIRDLKRDKDIFSGTDSFVALENIQFLLEQHFDASI